MLPLWVSMVVVLVQLPSSIGVTLCTRLEETEREACITLYTPVVDYLETAVAEEIAGRPMMGPLFIRLAWHSAGTYNGGLYPLGGTAGGCIRMPPESLDGANAKTNPAVILVYAYVAKYPFISFADMVQLVAAVVHEKLSGFKIQLFFSPGRPDFHIKSAHRECSPNGRLPAKELTEDTDYNNLNLTRQYIIKVYARYLHALDTEQKNGFYKDRFILEAVSLMGGHTVGSLHLDISGNDGNFTKHPYIFDNEFFVHLLEYEWDSRVRIGGGESAVGVQYVQEGVTMLPTDVAIIKHPQLRAATVAFADNNTLFLHIYATAWTRLVENGVVFADAISPPPPPPAYSGPESCLRSSYEGYHCEQRIFDGMVLHWRVREQNGTRLELALVSGNGGWFALGFPQSRGVMAPAAAVVLDEGGARVVQITAKEESAISEIPSNGVVDGIMVSMENGAAVLGFSVVRSEAVLSSLPINIAEGVDMKFAKHRNTAALVVNFVTGMIEEVTIESSLTFWRRLHGALMCFSCIFCFPLAIFTKRYSKRLFAISDASQGSKMGPAMKAHIILHLTGFTSMVVSIGIAIFKLSDSGNPDPLYHREIGIFIVSLLASLIILGVLSTVYIPHTAAETALKGKSIIRRVHRSLGAMLFAFLAVQFYSGAGRVSDTDADAQPFIILISSGAAFVVTLFIVGEICSSFSTIRSSTEREKQSSNAETKYRKTYTPQELAMHTNLDDIWIAMDGKVYNVTEWYEHHPGGADVLLGYAGRDASEAFYAVQHSAAGLKILRQFYVGDLEGEETSDLVDAIDEITQNTSQLDLDSARLQLTKDGSLPRSVVLSFRQLIDAVDSFLPYLPESLKLVYRAESNDPNKLIKAVHEQHSSTIAYLMESSPPTVCTIVFTDIQASTRLWEECEMGMQAALEVHNRTIRIAINDCNGYEVKTIGDAFMVAFLEATDAVHFATRVQCDLLTAEWPDTLLEHPMCERKYDPLTCELLWSGIKVRIGVHCGPVDPQINPLTNRLDFFGNTVNKAARVEAQALGGGTCMTPEVWNLVSGEERDLSLSTVTRFSLPDFEAYSLKAMTVIRRKDVKMKGIPNATDLLIVFPEGLGGRAAEDKKKAPKASGLGVSQNLSMSRNSSVAPPLMGSEITKAVATVCSPVFLPRRYAPEMEAASHTNTLISKMMLHASRGGGVTHSISGSLALVGFNIASPCINHPAAAAKFACTLCTETQDDDNDIIRIEPGVTMGIVTGDIIQGKMGRRTQKVLAIVGPAAEFSMRLAFHAEDLDAAVLCGVIPGVGGIPSDPLGARHCRFAEVWQTDLPEGLLLIYDLNIKQLGQNVTLGFPNEITPFPPLPPLPPGPPGTSCGGSEVLALPCDAKKGSYNIASQANAKAGLKCAKCAADAIITCTVCKILLCARCPPGHEGCAVPRYAVVLHEAVGVKDSAFELVSPSVTVE